MCATPHKTTDDDEKRESWRFHRDEKYRKEINLKNSLQHSITFVKCVKGDMWCFSSQTDDKQKILKVPERQAILKKVGEKK